MAPYGEILASTLVSLVIDRESRPSWVPSLRKMPKVILLRSALILIAPSDKGCQRRLCGRQDKAARLFDEAWVSKKGPPREIIP